MPVPFFDLTAQHSALHDELLAAFQRVLASGQFILGAEVEALEAEAAAYIQVPHAIGISSGTDALLLALMALDIGPGDEVLCPSFSFFATAGCIARLGARPVFVDACPSTFNLDVDDAASKVSPATQAIIPVHLFGQAVDMAAVTALANKHGLAVIEDVAQAMGAYHRDRQAGSWGDFGAFSFFPTKNLGGFGDGGLLTIRDDTLAAKARALRVHGASTHNRYRHDYLGGNFRLDALQAALLRVKLKYIEPYIRKRQGHAAYYNGYLQSPIGSTEEPLSGQAGEALITLPVTLTDNRHTWNQYTLCCATADLRNRLREYLEHQGIGSMIYYPLPLDAQPCFAKFVADGQSNPAAQHLTQTCLSLPIYPELPESQRAAVALAINNFLAIPSKDSACFCDNRQSKSRQP